jgi:hypothetical protein
MTPHKFVLEVKKQIGLVGAWLDKAAAHATAKKFDANTLLQARLSPDMLPFARQVQIACDTAKMGAARIAGKDAPAQADTEQTIDELRARVRWVIGYLDSYTAKDFEGAVTRTVTQPRWEGKVMTAPDYFVEHVVPNFYFHLSHVYAILRHNGVGVGKRDYLGALSQRAP